MRAALVVMLVLVCACPAFAAEETKPLGELDALKIKVLVLERQLIEAQSGLVQCRASTQFSAKARGLDEAIEVAAKGAGIDLKDGWVPDPDKRVWVKKDSK